MAHVPATMAAQTYADAMEILGKHGSHVGTYHSVWPGQPYKRELLALFQTRGGTVVLRSEFNELGMMTRWHLLGEVADDVKGLVDWARKERA